MAQQPMNPEDKKIANMLSDQPPTQSTEQPDPLEQAINTDLDTEAQLEAEDKELEDRERAEVEAKIIQEFGEEALKAAKESMADIEASESKKEDSAVNAAGSGASGRHQFMSGTWDDVTKNADLQYSQDDRFDKEKSTTGYLYFTAKNYHKLKNKLGRPPKKGELYVSHFLGESGGPALIKKAEESPDEIAEASESVLAQNAPYFYNDPGKSVQTRVNGKMVARWPNAKDRKTNKEVYDNLITKGGGTPEGTAYAGDSETEWRAPMAAPTEEQNASTQEPQPQAGPAPDEPGLPEELQGKLSPDFGEDLKDPSKDQTIGTESTADAGSPDTEWRAPMAAPETEEAVQPAVEDAAEAAAEEAASGAGNPEGEDNDGDGKPDPYSAERIREDLQTIYDRRDQMDEQTRERFDSIVAEARREYREEIRNLNNMEAMTALGIALAQLAAVAYAGAKGVDLTGVKLISDFPSFQAQRQQAGQDYRAELDVTQNQMRAAERRSEKQTDREVRTLERDVDREERRRRDEQRAEERKAADERERQLRMDLQERKEAEEQRKREFRAQQNMLDRQARRADKAGDDEKAEALEMAVMYGYQMDAAEDDKKQSYKEKRVKALIKAGYDADTAEALSTAKESIWFGLLGEETVPKAQPIDRGPTTQDPDSALRAQIKERHPDWDAAKVDRAVQYLKSKQQAQ